METPDAPLYRVPDDIAWIDGTEIGLGEELYLTRLPMGHTVLLRETARMVWHHAVANHRVLDRVASLVRLTPEQIRSEVENFLDQLVASGLLQPRSAEPAG